MFRSQRSQKRNRELSTNPAIRAQRSWARCHLFGHGLHSAADPSPGNDYLALIAKRNLAGLSYMKAGRALSEKLVSMDPSCYDGYLAIGVENYLLGVNAAPVRWILRLGGAETNKEQGIANLKLTAEKRYYLAPYARLLLAVAALRNQDRITARNLLAGLSRDFPQNNSLPETATAHSAVSRCS
jgi:hypothetical protein